MDARHDLDARPECWGTEPQFICVDPSAVSVRLFADPITGQLGHADLIDANGDVVVQLDVPADAADAIFLTPAG